MSVIVHGNQRYAAGVVNRDHVEKRWGFPLADRCYLVNRAQIRLGVG